MTNTEIEQQLALINAKTFPLEKIEAMIEFNKQYKKSSFYKKTHLSLEKLQQYYSFFKLNAMLDNINSWLDVDNLANRINNVLEGIDSVGIQNLLDKIVQTLNIEDLKKLKDSWSKELDTLKS